MKVFRHKSLDQCLPDFFPIHRESETGKYCIMDIKPAFEINIPPGSNPPGNVRNDSVIWHPALQLFWSRNNLLSFRYGMCIPSLCSQQDMKELTAYCKFKAGFGFD